MHEEHWAFSFMSFIFDVVVSEHEHLLLLFLSIKRVSGKTGICMLMAATLLSKRGVSAWLERGCCLKCDACMTFDAEAI